MTPDPCSIMRAVYDADPPPAVEPPDTWGHLTDASTPAEVAAADAAHDAWFQTPDGKAWLEWDTRTTAEINRRLLAAGIGK